MERSENVSITPNKSGVVKKKKKLLQKKQPPCDYGIMIDILKMETSYELVKFIYILVD